MTPRLLVLALLAPVAACQCYQPVDDCTLAGCEADAGLDAGSDAGLDAGLDAGSGRDAGTCAVWDGGGVGVCAAITGWAFQGDRCHGDCVLYPIQTPGLHPTLADCAFCGCRPERIVAWPSVPTPVGPTSHCDGVVVVTNQATWLEEVFPELKDGGCAPPGPNGLTACQLAYAGRLGEDGYARACAATLVPNVSEVQCRIYLP